MTSHGNPPKQPALDESLADREYDRLKAVLCSFAGQNAMDLEEMDGFFAALICGPVTIAPSVYLDEIWGGEEVPFDTVEDFNEFLNLAMRHWNFIARELGSKDMIFVLWLEVREGEELPRGNRWARGFLRGIDLCREEWDEIFEDEDKFKFLLSVMCLVHENDPDPELRTWKTPPDPELREKVIIGLSVTAQRFYDYFRSRRIREAQSGPGVARQTKIKVGRNEPCFCGSGKKYKRCCGSVAVN